MTPDCAAAAAYLRAVAERLARQHGRWTTHRYAIEELEDAADAIEHGAHLTPPEPLAVPWRPPIPTTRSTR